MATDTLGVLIHGAGWVSTQHIKAFQTNPFTRVVAISSRRLSSCQTRAEEAGLEDIGLYDDYDAALAHDGVDSKPLEYDDLEVALVKFDNGVLGKVSVNYGCIMPYAFPIEVFGNKGTFKDNRVWSHKYPGQTDWVEIPTIMPDSAEVTHHPFQGQMDHFVDCIRQERESHCNLEDGIRTCEVAFAAQQCYQSGRPVSLPLL